MLVSVRLLLGSALIALPALAPAASSGRLDIQPELILESRAFFETPQYEDQLNSLQGGVVLSGNLRWTSDDRRARLQFEPYFRVDTEDDERTYADIREATVSYRFGDWDILAGVGQVFWGVAESHNVVDVINQGDVLEDFDQGEKLGQPLIRLSKRGDFGTIEGYYLPYFRQQAFVGDQGRLRFDATVDTDNAEFERSGDEWAGDFALRYTNRFDAIDLGIHAFHGTSRQPALSPSDSGTALIPKYQEKSQLGLDVQYTKDAWLFKFESAGLKQGGDEFISSIAGFEYTYFDVRQRGYDIGLIAEFMHDGRDQRLTPQTLFDNDVFTGVRITLNDINDTALLAGIIADIETDALISTIQFDRRIGSNSSVELSARHFSAGTDPLVKSLGNDSHVSLRFSRYF